MLSKAYGEEAMKNSEVFLSGINCSKTTPVSKSQMKTVFIPFFNIKGTVHFEFISQGQTVNQAYCMETLKQLCEAVHRKKV
jgi:hypothetical protein